MENYRDPSRSTLWRHLEESRIRRAVELGTTGSDVAVALAVGIRGDPERVEASILQRESEPNRPAA